MFFYRQKVGAAVYSGPKRCEVGKGYVQWAEGDNLCYKFFGINSDFDTANTTCTDLDGWIASVKVRLLCHLYNVPSMHNSQMNTVFPSLTH